MDPSTKARPNDQRSREPPASMIGAEPIMRKSLVQRVIIAKFDDHLTSEVAESSRRSDYIWASKDMIELLVEVPSPVTIFVFVFILLPIRLGLCFRWSPSRSLATLQSGLTLSE